MGKATWALVLRRANGAAKGETRAWSWSDTTTRQRSEFSVVCWRSYAVGSEAGRAAAAGTALRISLSGSWCSAECCVLTVTDESVRQMGNVARPAMLNRNTLVLYCTLIFVYSFIYSVTTVVLQVR